MAPQVTEPALATSTSSPFAPTSTPLPVARAEGDILSEQQKQRLDAAALRYVAEDEASAVQVARSLGYIKNDGHPASVCGPLAIAILRDAGLLSKYIDLHAFWLLDPRDSLNMRTLERAFPGDEFLWYKTRESIADFDFEAFPLKAGDFLYLYAGDPGSFEHMLTVSRVDQGGQAFAVTNFNTPQGYVIREVLLYDPQHPGEGKFYDWTDRRNSHYGLTGFGGFDLWRFQVPVTDPTPSEVALADEIDQVIARYGGQWYVLLKEAGGKIHYSRRIRDAIHPASIIKVPIAMLFMKSLESQRIVDYQAALMGGFGGRSYAQLLKAMLVDSEENATETLLEDLERKRFDIAGALQAWKADSTDVRQRISSARDLAVVFDGLYGDFLLAQPRQILLGLLKVYTPGDDTRLGVIRKLIPEGYNFYNKRGTITDEFLTVSDCALVEMPTSSGKRMFVAGAYSFHGQSQVTYEDLVKAMETMARMFVEYAMQL